MAPHPPTFAHITPEFILSETTSVLTTSRRLRDHLACSLTPKAATFASVLVPLIDDENTANRRLKPLVFLASVAPAAELRDAARKVEKLIGGASAENLARQDIAALIQGVVDKGEDLGPEEAHLLNRKSNECVYVPPENRARYTAANRELGELLSLARKALAEGNDDGVAISRSDLDGLPESVLSTMQMVAEAEGDDGDGQVWMTFRKSHMRHVSSAATRKRFYVAKQKRFPENVERLRKIVLLRHEIARLQGLDNHADLKMREKMAKSVNDIKKALEDMKEKLRPVAQSEEQRLKRFEAEDVSTTHQDRTGNAATLLPWDWSYYDQKLKEQHYSVKTRTIAEYFEIQRTLEGLLGILSELFGLRFDKPEGEVESWHPEVSVYAVSDATHADEFLGYLYLDLSARPEKYAGAYQTMLAPGYVDANGSRHYPSSALVCSFARATDENGRPTPTLLQHKELRTMIHELGHSIHYLVSRTKYALPFSKDFVEIPSLLLEHWVWVPQVLKSLGRHYHDGTALSDRLIDDLARTKNVNQAHTMLTQVHLAAFDLIVHSPESHEVAQGMDLTRLWNETKRDIVGLSLGEEEDEGFGQAGFPHIFRKYDAGYFAYPLYVF